MYLLVHISRLAKMCTRMFVYDMRSGRIFCNVCEIRPGVPNPAPGDQLSCKVQLQL